MPRFFSLSLLLTALPAAGASPFATDSTALPASPDAAMLARVTPAIVSIFTGQLAKPGAANEGAPGSPMDRYFRPDADKDEKNKDRPDTERQGSGVIVSADGLILTNSHVVSLSTGNAGDSLTVELSDRRRFPAKLIGRDRSTDVALIKIDATALPTLTFADSDQVRVGDPVFAIGNPLGVGLTVTRGIVSALNRSERNVGGKNSFEGFIQTDAPINHGNSGGALTDTLGRFIGINSAIVSDSEGGGNLGIGFSIPSNLAKIIAERLLKDGKITRGYFGARSESVDSDIAKAAKLTRIAGVQLAEVTAGSPADKAGWKKDDIIVSVNGQPVLERGSFRLMLSLISPGEVAKCAGFHDGQPVAHDVTLSDEQSSGSGEFELTSIPGLRLKPVANGLEVVSVTEKSVANRKLKPGQVITALNKELTATAPALEAASHGGVNTFTVLAEGHEITVVLRLE